MKSGLWGKALLFLVLWVCVAHAAQSSQGGRSGFSGNPSSNGGATCAVCHFPGIATESELILTGPTVIDAASTHVYTLTLMGGPAVTAGVGISVSDGAGTLIPADSDLVVLDGELTHGSPKAFVSGTAVFTFEYQAPNYDADIRLFASSNSSNGQLDLGGDSIASASLPITVENGFEPPPPPPPPATGELQVEFLADGFTEPVVIGNAGDERMFVVERAGIIRIIEPTGRVLPTPFLNLRNLVNSKFNEEGMLGLAFHPEFQDNGFFYVYYIYDTIPGPGGVDRSRISRFEVSADPNVALPESEIVLLEFNQPYSIHNAGDMHFGPDGLLYIASGDGGPGNDELDNAQNPSRLLGKILRIDVNVEPGTGGPTDCNKAASGNYVTPANNAYADGPGGAGCDEIYALGVRNPWRFSFDRLTGAMWIGDVGQNNFEEITYIPPGAGGGLNLGWHCFEGRSPFETEDCDLEYYDPAYQYSHQQGDCSVTAGFVYRGKAFPVLDGQFFYADFCVPSIRALSGNPGALDHREVLPTGTLIAPSAFGEDADGEMYVADIVSGAVYRLLAVLRPGDVDGDGDVDSDDISLINRAIGTPADGPNDPRDVNDDASSPGGICASPSGSVTCQCAAPGSLMPELQHFAADADPEVLLSVEP